MWPLDDHADGSFYSAAPWCCRVLLLLLLLLLPPPPPRCRRRRRAAAAAAALPPQPPREYAWRDAPAVKETCGSHSKYKIPTIRVQ